MKRAASYNFLCTFAVRKRKNFVFAMKKLYIETYGCQMNVADSETVASIMKMADYDVCASEEEADAIFLNTCSDGRMSVLAVDENVSSFEKSYSCIIRGIIGY